MKAICVATVMLAAACERPAPPAESADTTSATTQTPDTPPAQSTVADSFPGISFDAGNLKAGDQVGPFVVTKIPTSNMVQFKGELEISGEYRTDVDPDMPVPCFFVARKDWAKLPRAQGDRRIIWFCFANREEAMAELGGAKAEATVVIDDYVIDLAESDVWNEARLIRVVRKSGL